MHSRAVIIGAGAVGLACAQAVAKAGFETFILEAGPRIAEGVTSRNSGVIHASLYYSPGSLKADLCLEGRSLLYSWCEKYGVSHKKLGKLVLAVSADQLTELHEIESNAKRIGATEVRMVSAQEAKRLEPSIEGVAALYSPETGIVDPYELSRSYLRVAEDHGATLATHARVLSSEKLTDGKYRIESSIGSIDADLVINSAGLYADEIAKSIGINKYTVYPWRGDYFTFRPGRSFSRLVYPVKQKGDPGLGVHLTIDLQGCYRLGPDVELSPSKEDFTSREDKLDTFVQATQKLFPWATREMLQYDTCGIRPKLRSPNDKADSDFIISEDLPGWINLLGIESPGLTASLAISEKVLAIVSR